MAPRPSPYTQSNPQLAALISSTSYAPVPSSSELEALQAALQGHAQTLSQRIVLGEQAESRAQAAERDRLRKAAVSPVRVLKKEQRTGACFVMLNRGGADRVCSVT